MKSTAISAAVALAFGATYRPCRGRQLPGPRPGSELKDRRTRLKLALSRVRSGTC